MEIFDVFLLESVLNGLLLGGLFAAAMAGSVVLLGWHFPSDAVGGFAIAGAGACLGAAALNLRVARAAPQSRWHRATG